MSTVTVSVEVSDCDKHSPLGRVAENAESGEVGKCGVGKYTLWGQGTRENLYTLLSSCCELKTALEKGL